MTAGIAAQQMQGVAMGGLAWVVAAVLLTAAAIVAVWPAGTTLRRLQGRPTVRRKALPNVDLAHLRERAQSFAERHPRRALGVSALAGAVPGGIVAGAVGGFVLAAYGALAARTAVRWAVRSRKTVMRARDLDDLVALAADLRAGLAGPPAEAEVATGWQLDARPTGTPADASAAEASAAVGRQAGVHSAGRTAATGAAAGRPRDARLAELTAAVWRLAERTGAPAADLIDRIESDARSADRSRASATAEAAGAQATALMMAVLPAGGIALGYGIGFDPLQVLLHTPLGAACAVGAVLLQCAGLLWSERLASGPAW